MSAGAPRTVAEAAKVLGVAESKMRKRIRQADDWDALPEDLQADVGAGEKTLPEAVHAKRARALATQ